MKKTTTLIKEVLDQGYLMSLGTQDARGVWVSDVIYVADENFNIYWLSDIHTRHSKAIEMNPQIGASITVSNNRGEQNIGLQLSGLAQKISGDILKIATMHRLKRGKPAPKELVEVLGESESWYTLTPTTIELIYEPLYGFTKQTLNVEYPDRVILKGEYDERTC